MSSGAGFLIIAFRLARLLQTCHQWCDLPWLEYGLELVSPLQTCRRSCDPLWLVNLPMHILILIFLGARAELAQLKPLRTCHQFRGVLSLMHCPQPVHTLIRSVRGEEGPIMMEGYILFDITLRIFRSAQQ